MGPLWIVRKIKRQILLPFLRSLKELLIRLLWTKELLTNSAIRNTRSIALLSWKHRSRDELENLTPFV